MEEVFLQAIRDQPTDDTTRLALADWLEERDDPRAELVRLLVALRSAPQGEARQSAEARQTALLAAGLKPIVPMLTNSIGIRFALVPPGTFLMGSAESESGRSSTEILHEVEITRAFYLSVFPITQEEYHRLLGENPSQYRRGGYRANEVGDQETHRFPVDNISWDQAVAFCHRLSALPAERQAGRIYRLPTEAEWEYACRAGTTSTFHFGNALTSTQANFNGRHPYGQVPKGPDLSRTCPVGSYPSNAWGLCDMHGNVWEWCGDWYKNGYYRKCARHDPAGPANGSTRILRGGSCWSHGTNCRSANRGAFEPGSSDATTGFRVLLVK